MTNTEAAWIAGVIDGDGCLQILENRPNKSAGGINPTFEATVSVTNTDSRITDKCHRLADGCVIGPVGRGKPGVWKPAYRWEVKRQKAGALLHAVLPYLVSKRDQAVILLRLISIIKPGSVAGNRGVIQHTVEQISQRRELRLAIKALNHRGGSTIPEELASALLRIRSLLGLVEERGILG